MTEIKYDLDLIHSLSRGNQEVIRRLILLFIEQSKEAVDELKKAYEETDFQYFRHLVHKVKPTYSYFGIKVIEDDLQLVELLAAFGMQSEELDVLLTRIEKNTRSVATEMHKDHILN